MNKAFHPNIKKSFYLIGIIFLFILLQCEKVPEIDESVMLDGMLINDSSIEFPEAYLISSYLKNPTAEDLNKPAILVVHGFTASTFEWQEFREYANTDTNVLVSQILLGGHGRSYEDFKNSTWEDWQKPIIDEYRKLDSIGFSNISLAGASTGCPLILDFISSNKFEGLISPKHVFFIDPIIIPSSKILSLAKIVGPLVGYISSENGPDEKAHYYNFTPQESLQQLEELLVKIRKDLEKGLELPENTHMKIYKSKKDGSADPVSAVLLYKGVCNSNNKTIEIKLVDSEFHVFTRLRGRLEYSPEDIERQQETFIDMINFLTSN